MMGPVDLRTSLCSFFSCKGNTLNVRESRGCCSEGLPVDRCVQITYVMEEVYIQRIALATEETINT